MSLRASSGVRTTVAPSPSLVAEEETRSRALANLGSDILTGLKCWGLGTGERESQEGIGSDGRRLWVAGGTCMG